MTGMVRASGPESPIDTATTSDAVPASFKRMACSRPISQNGFMLIFAPSKFTPVYSHNAFMQLPRREADMNTLWQVLSRRAPGRAALSLEQHSPEHVLKQQQPSF